MPTESRLARGVRKTVHYTVQGLMHAAALPCTVGTVVEALNGHYEMAEAHWAALHSRVKPSPGSHEGTTRE